MFNMIVAAVFVAIVFAIGFLQASRALIVMIEEILQLLLDIEENKREAGAIHRHTEE